MCDEIGVGSSAASPLDRHANHSRIRTEPLQILLAGKASLFFGAPRLSLGSQLGWEATYKSRCGAQSRLPQVGAVVIEDQPRLGGRGEPVVMGEFAL